jgi:hypothetical protein
MKNYHFPLFSGEKFLGYLSRFNISGYGQGTGRYIMINGCGNYWYQAYLTDVSNGGGEICKEILFGLQSK